MVLVVSGQLLLELIYIYGWVKRKTSEQVRIEARFGLVSL